MQNKIPTVVITRPEKQAQIWSGKLRQENIASQIMSLMEIKPFCMEGGDNELAIRSIKNIMLELDRYQKIIFVSQNAVEQGMEWIENYWPQIPLGVDFFAVGETTANLLRSYGVRVQDLAITTEGNMTSESLLRATGLQQVAGEKILIMRGVGGRGHLAEGLKDRGATPTYCEVYKRQIPAEAKETITKWLAALHQQERHWLLAFHSGETMNNFYQLLMDADKQNQIESVQKLTLLVPSSRLGNDAKKMGFHECLVAENATDDAMTIAAKHYFRSI